MRVCVVCAVEFAILRARATKIFQYSVRRAAGRLIDLG